VDTIDTAVTRLPVSVLIPVKNEQRNIADCLASVAWASEVVVVDSGSTDRTVEIAKEAGARVVQFAYVPGGQRKKNWALTNLKFRHEWILILDADERITPSLASEIKRAIFDPKGHSGFYLNRRFNFLGTWIMHAGYFPSWNLRLFRHGRGLYESLSSDFVNSGDNEVHEHVVLDGSAGRLRSPMDHFAYPTLADFTDKHRRYAYWEAEFNEGATTLGPDGSTMSTGLLTRRFLKRLARRFPFPHWARFAYHYFLKRGFLDGREGYVFCHLLAEYEFWIWARKLELESERKRQRDGRAQ
jgi:glycosyltransferase involved in cell wall biosynthesis